MARGSADEQVERFHATGGRVTAALGLLIAAVVAVLALVGGEDGVAPSVLAGAVLAGLLTWASMLRPGLWVTGSELVMRNMLQTVHVPLAAVEAVVVRQVLAVRAGDRRYVSTVVGKSRRKTLRPTAGGRPSSERPLTELAYADYVELRLRQRVDDARAAAGVGRGSAEQLALAAGVRREPAWLPIGLLAAAGLALVVTLLA